MEGNSTELLAEVSVYYSGKLTRHGDTPRGVDWNGVEIQELRFAQLSKVIATDSPFSVNDLGCGYGAYYDYLRSRYGEIFYCGIDISRDMIRSATERYRDRSKARFVVSSEPDEIADCTVASGIFNVCLTRSNEEWSSYLESTLEVLDRLSRVGFSFNCLTSYSDAAKMREDLYHGDPCALFDLWKRLYSRHVALLCTTIGSMHSQCGQGKLYEKQSRYIWRQRYSRTRTLLF